MCICSMVNEYGVFYYTTNTVLLPLATSLSLLLTALKFQYIQFHWFNSSSFMWRRWWIFRMGITNGIHPEMYVCVYENWDGAEIEWLNGPVNETIQCVRGKEGKRRTCCDFFSLLFRTQIHSNFHVVHTINAINSAIDDLNIPLRYYWL